MKDVLLILLGFGFWYALDFFLPEKFTDVLIVVFIVAYAWYYLSKIDKLENKVNELEEKFNNLWNREDNNMDFMMKNFRRLNKLEDKLGKQKKTTH